MHPTEVNRIRNEIRRLVVAKADMELVVDAARALEKETFVPLKRIVETGLVVTYCRPFSGARTVVDKLAPESALHRKIFEIRNKLYAHSDDAYEYRREAVDVFGEHSYAEQYQELRPESMQLIVALAAGLAYRFSEETKAREQSLRDAGVPPDPFD